MTIKFHQIGGRSNRNDHQSADHCSLQARLNPIKAHPILNLSRDPWCQLRLAFSSRQRAFSWAPHESNKYRDYSGGDDAVLNARRAPVQGSLEPSAETAFEDSNRAPATAPRVLNLPSIE